MHNSPRITLSSDLYIYFSKKRERKEEELGGKYPVDLLRNVGELGKGFVRDVYLIKAPKLTN